MATKKFQELQGYSDTDLKTQLSETQQEFQKLKFDHVIKGLDNPLLIREMRRDIARFRTEIRRREVTALSAEDVATRTKIRARRRK